MYFRDVWHYQNANTDLISRVIDVFDWERAFVNAFVNTKYFLTMSAKPSQKLPHHGDFSEMNCYFIPVVSKKCFSSIDLNYLNLWQTNKIRTATLTFVHYSKSIALITTQVKF